MEEMGKCIGWERNSLSDEEEGSKIGGSVRKILKVETDDGSWHGAGDPEVNLQSSMTMK